MFQKAGISRWEMKTPFKYNNATYLDATVYKRKSQFKIPNHLSLIFLNNDPFSWIPSVKRKPWERNSLYKL